MNAFSKTSLFCGMLLTVACAHKNPPEVAANPTPVEYDTQPHLAAAVDAYSPDEAMTEIRTNFQRIHFSTDTAEMTPDSHTAIQRNSELLKTFPTIRVEVQGHADERGTAEYNKELGALRAQAVVDKLGSMGVEPTRLKVVSYGENRPLDFKADAEAWAENRRVEFRVFSNREDAPVEGTVNLPPEGDLKKVSE